MEEGVPPGRQPHLGGVSSRARRKLSPEPISPAVTFFTSLGAGVAGAAALMRPDEVLGDLAARGAAL